MQASDTPDDSTLEFFFTDEKVPISLSPLNSDYWGNLIVMEQVVGTLIKYGGQGVYEPYLAKEWRTSKDEKSWSFYFYPGLKTEDGYLIDAASFATCLKRQLKIYAKSATPPTFSSLVGWEQFIDGDDNALGISVKSDGALNFQFTQKPSGFLEFLSMPYFGFFSPADYSGEKWKDEHKINSSGAYAVKEASEFKVALRAREGWHTLRKAAPREVLLSFSSLDDSIAGKSKFKILSLRDGHVHQKKEYVSFNSTPTLLTSFVLSPFLPPFNELNMRKAFQTVVRDISKKIKIQGTTFKKTDFFYDVFGQFQLSSGEVVAAVSLLKKYKTTKIKIFRQKLTTPEDVNFFDKILTEFADKTGWTFEVITPQTAGKDWMKKTFSNKEFPIRIGRVDTGGSPENWVVDMMFCSDLGVSFPDDKGSVCKVVKDYQNDKFRDLKGYWQAMHNAIEESAIVVPMSRNGFSWLMTKSISTETLSPTMNVPRFDLLELKR